MDNLGILNNARVVEDLLGHGVRNLRQIAASARQHYREKVEWRNGKERRLLIPEWRLKLIQIRFHRKVLRYLTPHPAAYSVRGRGAVKAAYRHRGNRWFYHRDIRNFYPSVRTAYVRERFVNLGLQEEMASLLVNLVTVENQLPQGAPTSPAVGEIALRRLDARISGLIAGHRLVYTRYLDDLTISGGQHLRDRFVHQIDKIIEDCGWELNDKGGLFGPNERHSMLGITVNQHLGVSHVVHDRVQLMVKLAQKGIFELTSAEYQSLEGKIGWIATVNPHKGARLRTAFERLPAALNERG